MKTAWVQASDIFIFLSQKSFPFWNAFPRHPSMSVPAASSSTRHTHTELCFIVKTARFTNWQGAGCWLSKCLLSSCYMLATWLNKYLFCQINILILKIVGAFISRSFGGQKSCFKVGRFCCRLSFMLLKKPLTGVLLGELRQVETGQWLMLFGLYMREIKKFCMLWFIVLPKFRDWNLMAKGRIVRNNAF